MKKLFIALLLSNILFTSLVQAEPNLTESERGELCIVGIVGAMVANKLESLCNFSGGVGDKYTNASADFGCVRDIPDEKVDLFKQERLKLESQLQKEFNANGKKSFCMDARKYYDSLDEKFKELRFPPIATKRFTDDNEYHFLSLDDLRIDADSLNGKKVSVYGQGIYIMNSFMLKKSSTDMSPMLIDITNLQRDQKQQILSQCGDNINGCSIRVYGSVGKVSYQNGIIAEKIKW